MKRAKQHLDKCEDVNCDFCSFDGLCMSGMRNTIGCGREDKNVEIRAKEVEILAMKASIEEFEKNPNTHLIDLAKKRAERIYNFVYKGHEYKASDSARAQNTCPHCKMKNPSGLMFKEDDKSVIYLGEYNFGNQKAECFECLSCFNKFFFHI